MAGEDPRLEAPSASTDGASWRPVLAEPDRRRALTAIDALAATTRDGAGSRDASLSGGSAGLALFHAQLACAIPSSEPSAAAERFLGEAIDVLGSSPLGVSFYAGFTGVAWAAEMVTRLLHPDGEDLSEGIDAALTDVLTRADWQRGAFDLIYGLTGLGLYALERWPRPAAVQSLGLVVDHLTARARHDEQGTYWFTTPSLLLGPRRQQHPAGGVDLGVAHGIAAVVPLLARARSLGVGDEVVDSMLDGAVRWLLAHAIDTGSGPTIPYFVAEDAEPQVARAAWCYGDPGVAATLLVAAREAQRPDWEEMATQLAVHAAERPPAAAGVVDAGFCHGSAGLAHLFNRMYQATGHPRLAEAARFWLGETLEHVEAAYADPPDGGGKDGTVPWNGPGLLEGAAGVALVLLAASTPVEPAWDRMFLISRIGPCALTPDGRP